MNDYVHSSLVPKHQKGTPKNKDWLQMYRIRDNKHHQKRNNKNNKQKPKKIMKKSESLPTLNQKPYSKVLLDCYSKRKPYLPDSISWSQLVDDENVLHRHHMQTFLRHSAMKANLSYEKELQDNEDGRYTLVMQTRDRVKRNAAVLSIPWVNRGQEKDFKNDIHNNHHHNNHHNYDDRESNPLPLDEHGHAIPIWRPKWLTDSTDFYLLCQKNEHLSFLNSLTKQPNRRDELDEKLIVSWVKEINFFKVFPLSFLKKICRIMHVERQIANEIIYQKGKLGHKMFILVRGKCRVYPSGDSKNGECTNVLAPGDCFGTSRLSDKHKQERKILLKCSKAKRLWHKLSTHVQKRVLMRDVIAATKTRTRLETIISSSDIFVVRLNYIDYGNLLYTFHEEQAEIYLKNIKRLSFFRNWSDFDLRALCMNLDSVTYEANTIICTQNSKPDHIYFLVDGSVSVSKDAKTESFRRYPISKNKWKAEKNVGKKRFHCYNVSEPNILCEESLFECRFTDCNVRATTKCTLYTLHKRFFLTHLYQEYSLRYFLQQLQKKRGKTIDAIQEKYQTFVTSGATLRTTSHNIVCNITTDTENDFDLFDNLIQIVVDPLMATPLPLEDVEDKLDEAARRSERLLARRLGIVEHETKYRKKKNIDKECTSGTKLYLYFDPVRSEL